MYCLLLHTKNFSINLMNAMNPYIQTYHLKYHEMLYTVFKVYNKKMIQTYKNNNNNKQHMAH